MSDVVLYSVNTRLAYQINDAYYNGVHSVWCTGVFDARSKRHGAGGDDVGVSPVANPGEIYTALRTLIRRGEAQTPELADRKSGIINGATLQLTGGVITDAQHREIMGLLAMAELADFSPLIYVIPFEGVKEKLRPVPQALRTHVACGEYVIDSLGKSEFDVIEVSDD